MKDKSNKRICGAKTRSGGNCQKAPVKGSNRCALHGGKSLKGSKSSTYKHGLYSKYAGDELSEVIEELEQRPQDEIIQPKHEIRLMQALILRCKVIQSSSNDLEDLNIVSQILSRLIVAKQRSQAILLEQKRLIPIVDIEKFLDYLGEIIETEAPEKASLIMERIKNFKLSKE